jgi:LuxR family maltose regulon positive regulatory protein
VRRAEPEGDVQAFAQARPHVVPTLRALVALDPRPFPLLLAGPSEPSAPDAGPSGNALLVDPLTERELEVLSYLPTYLPKADMARELVVSLNTLKSHVSHIYLKLGVANRREAVEAAQRLGLLPIALPAPDQDEARAAPTPARRPKNVPSPSEMPLT